MISRKPYLLRAMVQWAEDNGLTPLVAVDATVEGVQVPVAYVEEGRITLNVGFGAMHQREISNEMLTGHARFGGRSEFLQVPMAAVAALVVRETGEGMVFPDDLDSPAMEGAANETSEPSGLRLIDRQGDAGEPVGGAEGLREVSEDQDGDEPPRPPRGRPNLKLIK